MKIIPDPHYMIGNYFSNIHKMKRNKFLYVWFLLVITIGLFHFSCIATSKTKSATVYGQVAEKGEGIKGIVVSDGFNTTRTNKDGNYQLKLNEKSKFVFISLPSGYKIPNSNGIAKIYKTLDKNKNTQVQNFDLQKNNLDDNKHAFILWADPQVKTNNDVNRMLTETTTDASSNIKALGDIPVHGITCGDIVFEKFNLYPDYYWAVKEMGIPFFQVVGNHDLDYSASSRITSDDKFEAAFGPTYYSFNRGKIHYIILNDVFFKADDEKYKNTTRKYMGFISDEQLNWLKKDLQYVPKGTTLVISVHIPTYKIEYLKSTYRKEFETATVMNRDELYKLIRNYNVHIMSGHTHYNEVVKQGNRLEHNHAAVCGAWWVGDICTDGTPNGYGIYIADGDKISWHFEPTKGDKNYQIRVYAKGSSTDRPNEIIANVWNWDPEWKVEWIEDGIKKGEMEKYIGFDPLAFENMNGSDRPVEKTSIDPTLTEHIFSAKPSESAKKITIEATDRFGNKYSESIYLK